MTRYMKRIESSSAESSPPSTPTTGTVRLRFAVLGDVEPKVPPLFQHFRAAIEAVNDLARRQEIHFTASVGDLAHQGKVAQYEEISAILSDLNTPFYAIMGNEEVQGSAQRFMEYAVRWNRGPDGIPGPSYTKEHAGVLCLFASASTDGLSFTDEEGEWMLQAVDAARTRPVIAFTHAPIPDLFPEAESRTQKNAHFDAVCAQDNVVINFFGHIHMDLDTALSHRRDRHGVYHIHAPGIERTKIGSSHTPRLRIVSIGHEGDVLVETYNVQQASFEQGHELRFRLDPNLVC